LKLKADIIYMSSAIFTGENINTIDGAIAIKGNRIIAVGDKQLMSEFIDESTEVFDFGDKLIMPGFNDSHVHFMYGAIQNDKDFCVELYDCTSEAECVERVKKFAEEHPDNPWIFGRGWSEADWTDGKEPNRRSLDAVFPDRPVFLSSQDIHSAWVNKKALDMVGFDRNTPDLEDGYIEHFSDGEPSGILREPGVCDIIQKEVLLSADLKSSMYSYQEIAVKYGITSIGNVYPYGGIDEDDALYLYKDLENEGLILTRFHLFTELRKDLSAANKYEEMYCSDKVRFAGLKKIIDGVCEAHTGYLLEPYADDPMTRGQLQVKPEALKELVMNADTEGYTVRLHCIGNGAVSIALDCFEEARRVHGKGCYHAIEHIETCHPDDIPRFGELDVIASMQPIHLTLNIDGYPKLLGEKWMKTAWPIRSLLDTGAHLACSSDFPVVGLNPLEGVYAAITRKTLDGYPEGGFVPQERIQLGEVLRGYTYGSALLENFDEEIGTISIGKLADIVVLDKNLFRATPEEILDTKVLITMINGEVVYKSGVKMESSVS
jgi:predicted amidohydrolase YtcJ